MNRELRTKISEILVKYRMPTRQIAISEIMQILTQERQEVLEIIENLEGHGMNGTLISRDELMARLKEGEK